MSALTILRTIEKRGFHDHLFTPFVHDYEKDLDMILRGSKVVSLEEVSDEIDMYSFNETRAENLLVIRTRLETAYEEKEAARRGRKWQAQGKWNGDEIENSELLGLE